jgi:hypothetical protein
MRFTFVILLFLSLGADAQMIIKAHANYRPYAVAAQNLLLDDYPNAAAAYSLRKLDKDYTGSAIRVRRSNDNSEQDIGFVGNDLDTASLKTFVGANSGFVTTWYDQSGNARNATQTTAANQPRVVNAGTVERRSGDISLVYDGSNDFLEAALTYGATISPTSFYAVSSRSINEDNIRTIFSTGILGTGERGYGLYYADQTFISAQDKLVNQTRFSDAQISGVGIYTNTINTNNLLFSTITTTSNNTWYNGGNNSNANYSYTNNTTTQNITIGVRRASTSVLLAFYLNGSTTEIVIWQSDQSSNRTGIENNINDYYNIYWNGDFAGLLDSFPSSAAAYSLRNLDKDYLGPLVRVRRSNDNAEQDIYGDYYGNLDTVGLKNFVGASSGFVTVWYDQSGSARNATQTTAAQQPNIVNTGTVVRNTTNGKVVVNWTLAGVYNLFTSNVSLSGNITTFSVYNTATTSVGAINSYGENSNNRRRAQITWNGGSGGTWYHYASAFAANLQIQNIVNNQNVINYTLFDHTNQQMRGRINGGTEASGNFTLINPASSPIRIGATGLVGEIFSGNIFEVIFYNSNQSSNRSGIENNINSYYGIY